MKLDAFDVYIILYGLNRAKQSVKDDPEPFGIEFDWDNEQKYDDDVIKVINKISQLEHQFQKILDKNS